MKHTVYHGEYSLSHWIDLLLSKNIILPEYQRIFVWSRKKVEEFMNAVKDDQFIPPVTIGMLLLNGKKVNYILDGQQRLTSILLTLFEVYPKKGKDAETAVKLMNENDDVEEEIDVDDVLNWTLKHLTNLGDNYNSIDKNLKRELYDKLDLGYTTGDYKKHYLPFSYIVPTVVDEKAQQQFYSSVFRNINITGQRLSELESRESLYFLDKNFIPFFKYRVGDYHVKLTTSKAPLDFVRYMALLSQYAKDLKIDNIAAGYGKKATIEDYYEEYIYEAVGSRGAGLFKPFTDIFANGNFQDRLDKLTEVLPQLEFPVSYSSIIDIDVYFFGLFYYILIEGKDIDIKNKKQLIEDIKKGIEEVRKKDKHEKSPAALKYLRMRMSKSIDVYSTYLRHV